MPVSTKKYTIGQLITSVNPGKQLFFWLVLAIPSCLLPAQTPVEFDPGQLVTYPLELQVTPPVIRPGESVQMEFTVLNPVTASLERNFHAVEGTTFQVFVVSRDLTFFRHEQTSMDSDGIFRFHFVFPRPGLYRILSRFQPEGAPYQLVEDAVIVSGDPSPIAAITRDYSEKQSDNLRITLSTDPPQPYPGSKIMLFFHVDPVEGLEQYLGDWAQLFVASEGLIDVIYEHPFVAEGGPQIQFNVYFPRASNYRAWVQFRRDGIVNTVHFDIPVEAFR
jgi:hypothetical protein